MEYIQNMGINFSMSQISEVGILSVTFSQVIDNTPSQVLVPPSETAFDLPVFVSF